MNSKPTPQSILQEIAQIQRMEKGSLHVIRRGPSGPYYNHQFNENGKHVSEYVPQAQADQMRQDIEAYQLFQRLMTDYADQIIEKTRQERGGEVKKKRLDTSSPKTRKSSS